MKLVTDIHLINHGYQSELQLAFSDGELHRLTVKAGDDIDSLAASLRRLARQLEKGLPPNGDLLRARRGVTA